MTSEDADIRDEPCPYCENGRIEGRPIPTPDGPHYPLRFCNACKGTGILSTEYVPVSEDDLFGEMFSGGYGR
jgi:hypothetical protein